MTFTTEEQRVADLLFGINGKTQLQTMNEIAAALKMGNAKVSKLRTAIYLKLKNEPIDPTWLRIEQGVRRLGEFPGSSIRITCYRCLKFLYKDSGIARKELEDIIAEHRLCEPPKDIPATRWLDERDKTLKRPGIVYYRRDIDLTHQPANIKIYYEHGEDRSLSPYTLFRMTPIGCFQEQQVYSYIAANSIPFHPQHGIGMSGELREKPSRKNLTSRDKIVKWEDVPEDVKKLAWQLAIDE